MALFYRYFSGVRLDLVRVWWLIVIGWPTQIFHLHFKSNKNELKSLSLDKNYKNILLIMWMCQKPLIWPENFYSSKSYLWIRCEILWTFLQSPRYSFLILFKTFAYFAAFACGVSGPPLAANSDSYKIILAQSFNIFNLPRQALQRHQ